MNLRRCGPAILDGWSIGKLRREYLDRSFFWNVVDLARKLDEFKVCCNAHRRGLFETPIAA
ncbi:MAG: hypothetical protein IPJ21_11685 [Sterolibacteriaceae bacterium]|nr:hypothetical protein [Sterolibacteriaceae bacterium]MBK9084517.1 hypothetical protein [Sterolibacteriaceae bacterium]